MAERLFLIDGSAHLYQVFYAIRGLTAPDGEPVNAVYGFARMLHKLQEDYDPDYLAVAWDPRGEVFRHKIYEEYKANRKPMPKDLQRQLPLIEELLKVRDIPKLVVEGYEADDVMGTVSKRAEQEGVHTVLVTTDKDAEQLISDRTSVLHMHKNDQTFLDVEKLKEEKGLEPWQVIELMALCGDNSDNIPGVRGVGPKTAAKLIDQFGNVENLYENIEEVSGEKLREKLQKNRDQVELARKLVTIDRDIPLDMNLTDCRVDGGDPEEVTMFYRSLGFRTLAGDKGGGTRARATRTTQSGLFDSEPDTSAAPALKTFDSSEVDYRAVTTADELHELAGELEESGRFAVDLETTSLEPRDAEIVGYAFSTEPEQGVYVPVAGPSDDEVCDPEQALQVLTPLLEDESVAKIGQNLKYDIAVLKNYGVDVAGVECDTMVASYLLDPAQRSHGLDALTERHLHYRTVKIKELIGSGSNQRRMDTVPVSKVTPYACEDADIALRLSQTLGEALKEEGLWELFTSLEVPLVPVLAQMEWNGIKVDREKLARISKEFEQQLSELEENIFEEAGERFNVNSPAQLSEILFEKMDLPVPKGKKRQHGYSTEFSVLENLQSEHEIARYLIEHRQISKLKSTYADALQELVNEKTGRVHCSFNQTATATGRLSSSEPNLQNIPVRTALGRRIRSCFVPGGEEMSLLSADYSQVELRVLAHCSEDERLRQAFNEGRDIHTVVAARVHDVSEDEVTPEMRRRAKAVNFGIIYGQQAYGLSRQIGTSVDEARGFIDDYFAQYPAVKEFIGSVVEQAREDGFVKTLAGRIRFVPGIRSSGSRRSAAERIAVNTVIQGTAADLIKRAMIRIHDELPGVSEKSRMLLQIHDELVFEVPDNELDEMVEFVTDRMSGAMDLSVPLKVDIATGKNWEEAK